ncbi:MAG: magnesium transporter [Pseudomonadota bacterium]
MDTSSTSQTPNENDGIYSELGAIRSDFLDRVIAAVDAENADYLHEIALSLHESELADVLETLGREKRRSMVRMLGEDFDFTVLTEVDDAVRLDLVEDIPNEQIAKGVADLDTDDAVYILEDLEQADQAEILKQLPFTERIRLRRSLDYPEDSAGRRMNASFVAVPPFWNVGQAIDYLRDTDDLPETFAQIFVVDPTFKLVGAIDLDMILRSKRDVQIEDIKRETRHFIPAEMDQEEAAHIFEQYDLLSAAVLDENERLVGVLTIDDIVDVIQEEADEDIKRLAGVGNEEISDNVLTTTKSRFIWLLVNLGTAVLASLVIGVFDATIQQMVALAVLMPIVASMGGNAGTQTMTVAVRALAVGDIDIYNSRRIILRELLVGLINGVLFAVVIGTVTLFWFGNPSLGGVIAIAMVVNMMFAALAGILVPLILDKVGADPATASSVFVTTVTDVVGFFAFLGLAAIWFGI